MRAKHHWASRFQKVSVAGGHDLGGVSSFFYGGVRLCWLPLQVLDKVTCGKQEGMSVQKLGCAPTGADQKQPAQTQSRQARQTLPNEWNFLAKYHTLGEPLIELN